MNQVKQEETSKSMEETAEEDATWLINNVSPLVVVFAGMGIAYTVWNYWKDEWIFKIANSLRDKLKLEEKLSLAELGQAGDIFGGINALFAAFAFIGVACAAYYQRKTFLQQLEDSKASREAFKQSIDQQKSDSLANKIALEESRVASKEQINTAKTEMFNSFIFRMLSEVDATMKNIKLIPKSVFGQWHNDAEEHRQKDDQLLFVETMEHINSDLNGVWHQIKYYDLQAQSVKDQINYDPVNFVVKYHDRIYIPNRRTLAPFLRNFYHTFTIIKEQKISYLEQCKYSKIARASINEQILILVMLNGLSKEGKNLKPIIEEYGLLKHLSKDGNTAHARLIAERFYNYTAFAGYEKRNEYHTQKELEASLR